MSYEGMKAMAKSNKDSGLDDDTKTTETTTETETTTQTVETKTVKTVKPTESKLEDIAKGYLDKSNPASAFKD